MNDTTSESGGVISVWRQFGRWYAVGRIAAKSPGAFLLAVQLALTLELTKAVIEETEEAVELAYDEERVKQRTPPVETALEKSNRYLPMMEPDGRTARAWPPFEGHMHDLGETP